jgi:SET and MYND domain-containing protein 5
LRKGVITKFLLRPLETAQENARRLTANPHLVLPNSDCDETVKEAQEICPHCATNFCSLSCKENAWNHYHKTLCTGTLGTLSDHPLEKLNEAWK